MPSASQILRNVHGQLTSSDNTHASGFSVESPSTTPLVDDVSLHGRDGFLQDGEQQPLLWNERRIPHGAVPPGGKKCLRRKLQFVSSGALECHARTRRDGSGVAMPIYRPDEAIHDVRARRCCCGCCVDSLELKLLRHHPPQVRHSLAKAIASKRRQMFETNGADRVLHGRAKVV